jgi:hypothetical protein
VQRHGRIDRIGSPHKRVVIGCFFPAANLDKLLHLEETLQRKIAYANAAIGAGTVLPDQIADPTVEILLHDTRAEIMDLYEENAVLLAEGGGSGALSGEEYRRRLGRAMNDTNLQQTVRGLPYGSGSGFVSRRVRQAGYVFCVRIGTHPTPWFRFVAADATSWMPLAGAGGTPWIDDDTLTCLIAADPGDNEDVQVLNDAALVNVFAAWERARTHVHVEWLKLTDWAHLQPRIEKALRDAITLVFDHGAFLGLETQDDLIRRLNGRWEAAIVRAVREIVRSESTSPEAKVRALQVFVTETGLPIPEVPRALPHVRIEDVRVICWMAVAPTGQ